LEDQKKLSNLLKYKEQEEEEAEEEKKKEEGEEEEQEEEGEEEEEECGWNLARDTIFMTGKIINILWLWNFSGSTYLSFCATTNECILTNI
jgi:hypothetical protein